MHKHTSHNTMHQFTCLKAFVVHITAYPLSFVCDFLFTFIRIYKTYSHWSEFNLSNAAGYYSNFLILLTSCEDNTMHFHYFPIMTFYFKIFHQNNPGFVCCYDITFFKFEYSLSIIELKSLNFQMQQLFL